MENHLAVKELPIISDFESFERSGAFAGYQQMLLSFNSFIRHLIQRCKKRFLGWNGCHKKNTTYEWLWNFCEEWSICWLPANTPFLTMLANVILYSTVKINFYKQGVKYHLNMYLYDHVTHCLHSCCLLLLLWFNMFIYDVYEAHMEDWAYQMCSLFK